MLLSDGHGMGKCGWLPRPDVIGSGGIVADTGDPANNVGTVRAIIQQGQVGSKAVQMGDEDGACSEQTKRTQHIASQAVRFAFARAG